MSRPATSESDGFVNHYNLEGDRGGEDDQPEENSTVEMSKKKNVSAGKKKRDEALKSEVCLPIYSVKIISYYLHMHAASYHQGWHQTNNGPGLEIA